MGTLTIYWNLVDANVDFDPSGFTPNPNVSGVTYIPKGSKGVFFRAVVSEEPNANDFLSDVNFQQLRRARNTPDTSMLFRPKPPDQQSIGTLRIVRPKRFAQIQNSVQSAQVNGQQTSYTLANQQGTVFDVLLESTSFILENAQEQMAERFQLQETFGDFNVFFFGKRAEIFTYSGTLLNAADNLQWKNQFLDNYENFLRGTKCAELKARAYFLYDDVLREGFVLSAGIDENAVVQGAVKFNFTLLVTGKRILGVIPQTPPTTITVPKKPSNNQFGINTFLYKRATDESGLPGVSVGVNETVHFFDTSMIQPSQNFALVVNDSLPGDDAPADLKQAMLNQALAALQKINSQGTTSANQQTVDYDVLYSFIDAQNLPNATKRSIAGSNTMDASNASGQTLVQRLIANETTVDQLRLVDAVSAADNFANQNATQAGDVASALKILAAYFAPNGAQRIAPADSSPITAIADIASNTSPDRYVLASSLDNVLLDAVISQISPLENLNIDALNNAAITQLNVGSVDQFLQNSPQATMFTIMQYYVAALCLIPDNTGTFFTAISGTFTDMATLGDFPDALSYIRSKKIGDFFTVLNALVPQVSTAIDAAFGDIQNSGLFQLIQTKVGMTAPSVTLTEKLLSAAAGSGSRPPFCTITSAKFIHALGVYITSLTAELNPQAFTPISTDTVAGTVRRGDSGASSAGPLYFTKDVAADFVLLQDTVTDMIAIEPDVPISSMIVPDPLGSGGSFLITPVAESQGAVVVRDTQLPVKETMNNTGDPDRLLLQSLGFTYLTPAQAVSIGFREHPVIYYFGTRRNVPAASSNNIDLHKNADDIFGAFSGEWNTGTNKQSTATLLTQLALARAHYGGQAIQYVKAALTGISSTTKNIGTQAQQGIDAVTQAVRDFLTQEVDNALTIPPTPSNVENSDTITQQLALTNFATVTEIQTLITQLQPLGIQAKDYIQLLALAKTESQIVSSLNSLKSSLSSAVANAQLDPSGPAAQVAQSDASNKANLVGP